MTFRDKYNKPNLTWADKASIMEIFHLTMLNREGRWTVKQTSEYFRVSTGLVSENLKLAGALHNNPELAQFSSRQVVLDKLK